NSGGSIGCGLRLTLDYWIIRVDANTLKLAATFEQALAGTAVDITSAGSGTNKLVKFQTYYRLGQPGGWIGLGRGGTNRPDTALYRTQDIESRLAARARIFVHQGGAVDAQVTTPTPPTAPTLSCCSTNPPCTSTCTLLGNVD